MSQNNQTINAAARPPHELALYDTLSATRQQVMDESGNPSALWLGAESISVQGATNHGSVLQQIQSSGTEACMEFVASGGRAWRIGVAGAEAKQFFLWGGDIVLLVDGQHATFRGDVTVEGTLTAASAPKLKGLKQAGTAPAGANLEAVFVDVNTGELYYQ